MLYFFIADALYEALQLDEKGMHITTLHDYYGDYGVRKLCHDLKNGDQYAIQVIGEELSEYVDKDTCIVPVPSHNGRATNNLKIAEVASMLSGSNVDDILFGNARQTLYDYKRKHNVMKLDNDFFGFKTLQRKYQMKYVLFDGVMDTGTTLKCASMVTGIKDVLVFAKTMRN